VDLLYNKYTSRLSRINFTIYCDVNVRSDGVVLLLVCNVLYVHHLVLYTDLRKMYLYTLLGLLFPAIHGYWYSVVTLSKLILHSMVLQIHTYVNKINKLCRVDWHNNGWPWVTFTGRSTHRALSLP